MKQRLIALALSNFVITLCLAVIFIFEPSPPVIGALHTESASIQRQNYALLPLPIRVSHDIYLVRRTENSPSQKATPVPAEAIFIHNCPPTFHADFSYVSFLDDVFYNGSREGCRLLDIPPPSV